MLALCNCLLVPSRMARPITAELPKSLSDERSSAEFCFETATSRMMPKYSKVAEFVVRKRSTAVFCFKNGDDVREGHAENTVYFSIVFSKNRKFDVLLILVGFWCCRT